MLHSSFLFQDQLEKVTEREREYGQWRVDALMEEMEVGNTYFYRREASLPAAICFLSNIFTCIVVLLDLVGLVAGRVSLYFHSSF